MQYLEVSGAVRPLKWSLGVKWLNNDFSVTAFKVTGSIFLMDRVKTYRIVEVHLHSFSTSSLGLG